MVIIQRNIQKCQGRPKVFIVYYETKKDPKWGLFYINQKILSQSW